MGGGGGVGVGARMNYEVWSYREERPGFCSISTASQYSKAFGNFEARELTNRIDGGYTASSSMLPLS